MREIQRPQTLRWGISILVLIVIFILWISPLGKYIRIPFAFITTPIVKTGSAVIAWIGDIPKPLQEKRALLKENESLKNELQRMQEENSLLRSIITDADTEKKLQEYVQRFSSRSVFAHVIGRSEIGRQTMLIDKGTKDGIARGLPVIVGNGTIIGTIDEVFSQTSRILLITDPSQAIAAKVQNANLSAGVVKGTYGVSLSMELIPKNDSIENDQTVVTSSVSPLIPPNIVIGKISRVVKDEGAIFQRAQITIEASLDKIELVSIIDTQNVNP